MDSKRVRGLIFSFLLLIIIPPIIFVDYCCLLDPTIIIYSATAIISLVCFILYAWWWISLGKASHVYMAITLLFLSTFFTNLMNLFARILFVYDKEENVTIFLNSNIWQFRSIVGLIIMIYLLSFTISRMISGNGD
jgi:hypothetical protein